MPCRLPHSSGPRPRNSPRRAANPTKHRVAAWLCVVVIIAITKAGQAVAAFFSSRMCKIHWRRLRQPADRRRHPPKRRDLLIDPVQPRHLDLRHRHHRRHRVRHELLERSLQTSVGEMITVLPHYLLAAHGDPDHRLPSWRWPSSNFSGQTLHHVAAWRPRNARVLPDPGLDRHGKSRVPRPRQALFADLRSAAAAGAGLDRPSWPPTPSAAASADRLPAEPGDPYLRRSEARTQKISRPLRTPVACSWCCASWCLRRFQGG